MTPPWQRAHTACVLVEADAASAFAFMADGMKQTRWALGSWDRRIVHGDVFVGTSLFDNKELYVRLRSDPRLMLVDYDTGADPKALIHEVEARVVPGRELGYGDRQCLVTLTVWRPAATSDAEWELVHHVWQTEIHLIKGCIERERDGVA